MMCTWLHIFILQWQDVQEHLLQEHSQRRSDSAPGPGPQHDPVPPQVLRPNRLPPARGGRGQGRQGEPLGLGMFDVVVTPRARGFDSPLRFVSVWFRCAWGTRIRARAPCSPRSRSHANTSAGINDTRILLVF